jgi:hypothetical protein
MQHQSREKIPTPHLTEAFEDVQPVTKRINRTLIAAGVVGLVLLFNSSSAAQKDVGDMPAADKPTTKTVISPSR